MADYKTGDRVWWDTGVRGAYGHTNLSTITAQFKEMSASGKRARIRVVGPDGKLLWSTYVKPTAIWSREGPFGELGG